jgi:hypothetical protein
LAFQKEWYFFSDLYEVNAIQSIGTQTKRKKKTSDVLCVFCITRLDLKVITEWRDILRNLVTNYSESELLNGQLNNLTHMLPMSAALATTAAYGIF